MEPTSTIADNLNIKIATINGRQLVAGLYWEKLDKVRSYMSEAREKGKRLGMDIVAIRHGAAATQAGFSPKNRGALKGMYSLAAVVASAIGDDALCAFKLDDGAYALIGTLDGLIVPGCDAIGEREEIDALFREMLSRTAGTGMSWKRLYAPAEFSISEDRFDPTVELTAQAIRKEHRLQPLTLGLSRAEVVRYGALAATAMIVLAGGLAVKDHLDMQRAKHAAQAALAAAEAQARATAAGAVHAKQAALAAIPQPWATQAPVRAFLRACNARLNPLPLSIAGWIISSAHCAQGQVLATYTRHRGAPYDAFARAVLAHFGGAPAPLNNDFDQAAIGGQFPAPAGADETLLPASRALAAFVSHFQALDTKLSIQPAPPPASPATNAAPAPVIPWRTYAWSVSTGTPPAALFTGLNTDGVRMTAIDVHLDAHTATLRWKLTGDLYVD